MNNPLVSVVVPIYNTEQYLCRCVDSIRNQTYENLEIILVDDESPDGSPQICDDYLRKDSRIKVIHKKNGGVSSARNAGIDAATGEYISFIDSDDYIEKDMYHKMVQSVENADADICMCRGVTQDKNVQFGNASPSEGVQTLILTGSEMLDRLVKSGAPKYAVVWNKLYAKRLFNHVRFVEGKQHEDEQITHHLYGLSNKVVLIDDIFYVYQIRENSIMHEKISAKRLDVVDALIDRVHYLRAHDAEELALWTLVDAVGMLTYLSIMIQSDKEANKRVRNLRQELCQLREHILPNAVLSKEQRMKLFMLRVFPVYVSLRRLCRLVRK